MAGVSDHLAAEMKRPCVSLVTLICLSIGTAYICQRAFAQPFVLETPSIYVDASEERASDSNSGSRGAPLRTIQRAVDLAARSLAHKLPVRIIVGPGTYREAITITGLGHPSDPALTIEARVKGQTIVSGSDVWIGWRRDSGRMLVHKWQYAWGTAPNPRGWPELQQIVRKREMVFVNGVALEQSLGLPLPKPGTFAVDGASIVVNPPSNTDPQLATIEVAVRPVLLKSSGHANNLTLRGLVFEHANTAAGYGTNAAVVLAGSNITLEDCKFDRNNWVGLSIATADHIRLVNCTADNNGENGISMWRVSQLQATNLSTSGDNWRGAAGNFLGWDADGFKALSLHDATFINYRALNNRAGGMWLDTDNVNIVIRDAVVSHNLTNGFFFEKNQGPIVVSGSTIARNRDSGVQGSYSTNVSLIDDLICANEVTQVRIAGRDGVIHISDHWNGQPYQLSSAHWKIQNSRIIATSGSQGLVGTYLSSSWPDFASTLTSNNNLWARAAKVQLPGIGQRGDRDPQKWLRATGRDSASRYADATPGSCPK
jgi:parallel beta-helix repeat protein